MPDKFHTIKSAISDATDLLLSKEIPTARLDSEVLMAFATGLERVDIYKDESRALKSEEKTGFDELIKRRSAYEPVAYIRNKKEFFSLEFYVDENVMIPRPETELLVTRAIELIKDREYIKVIDIGTGSGAIPISILSELSDLSFIYASDISSSALNIAKKNATLHNCRSKLRFLNSNLFSDINDRFDLIISNPPYIKSSEIETLARDVMMYEPRLALDGGQDGLKIIGQLIENGIDFLTSNGAMLIEIGSDESESIGNMEYCNKYSNMEFIKDYSGKDRILYLKR